MSIETANALRAAKARIDTPEKWCKGANMDGERLCAWWTVRGFAQHINFRVYNQVVRALHSQLPKGVSVPAYNDLPTTTHADIMALYDRAIADEESAP